MAKIRNYDYLQELHYLKDDRWSSGELCYWRNSDLYSPKEKAKLELRLKKMLGKNGSYRSNAGSDS